MSEEEAQDGFTGLQIDVFNANGTRCSLYEDHAPREVRLGTGRNRGFAEMR